MSDPFRNYDAWLTTDRMAEAAERDTERLADLWAFFVNELPELDLPADADEPEHPEHGIYAAWKRFIELADERRNRLEAEAEAAMYEAEQKARDEMVGKPCGCPEGGFMVRRFGGYVVCSECGRDA